MLLFARRLESPRHTRHSLPAARALLIARALLVARALPAARGLLVGGLLALAAGGNAVVALAALPGSASLSTFTAVAGIETSAASPSLSGPTTGQEQEPGFDDELFQAMRWRNIGPHRGGRSVTVAGVVSDLDTYYFGATGGGVWKTTDAGETWNNVTDGFLNTGSVGAVEVSTADPNVVYVGMGEHAVRGVANSHGDGVYRSTDAGKTWTHLGLERSRHISRIRIHPNDPDLVYVAVQGADHGDSEDRGIYRSADGGQTWEKILYVSERSGASDLSMDANNPRILYAAFWDHRRWPWKVESGGPGSGLWKSTDGGDNWEQINDGLPELMGKTGIDVSRANPERVFAIVEAEPGQGGLYRSDDGGESWEHVNGERIIQARSWYYMEVFADPVDEHTVYVMNAPFLKSIDGGRTFTEVQVPHGDNHDLWINPTDNRVMINANDGGANVSFNGGASWSTQRNQPTAQFYRVITDNQFPYRVYGGQQDNSSVSIASAAPGGIGWKDWYAVSGCESAYLAFDPDDPEYVLGTCIEGDIDVWDRKTREVKPIRAYPELNLGVDGIDQRYRFDWNNPVVVSPHDPTVYYQAGNVLFRTADRGQSWEVISPDLTFDDPEKQVPSGPITNEAAGGEIYNVIMYVAESPHEAGTIWAGTNDGRVQLTRDGGANWSDVTPDFPAEGMVNMLEISPHDPGKVFVVFTRYKFDDFTPHVYRTTDYGANWEHVADGFADEAWVRVVREDPVRKGLLYAGTETGVYISFDDGSRWEKWQLNLPIVPVTDLVVHDTDLVAATQGRAFWILDDLSPVRQLTDEVAADVHLFAPRDAVLVNWDGGFGGDGPRAGESPPSGALIYYTVGEGVGETAGEAAGERGGEPEGQAVTIEILDGSGEVVRTYATDADNDTAEETATSIDAPRPGLNRIVWDFRRDTIEAIPGLFVYNTPPEGLPGRVVPPGDYTVRLTVDGESFTEMLHVAADPRKTATAAQYGAQDRFLAEAGVLLVDVNESLIQIRSARRQIEGVIERMADADADEDTAATVSDSGEELIEKIDEWEGVITQTRQETFQDVVNFPNKFNAQIIALLQSVDGTEPPVTAGAGTRLVDLQAQWEQHRVSLETLLGEDLEAFNEAVRAAGVPAVIIRR